MSREEQYWEKLVFWLDLYVRDERLFWPSWLKEYSNCKMKNFPVENLPEMLSMLALPFRRGMSIQQEGWRLPGKDCAYDKISNGIQCLISNNSTMNNIGIDRDHWWPASLGGIEHPSNQLDLCKHHNKAKMNGLWGYPWMPSSTPIWIVEVLNQMAFTIKRRLHT